MLKLRFSWSMQQIYIDVVFTKHIGQHECVYDELSMTLEHNFGNVSANDFRILPHVSPNSCPFVSKVINQQFADFLCEDVFQNHREFIINTFMLPNMFSEDNVNVYLLHTDHDFMKNANISRKPTLIYIGWLLTMHTRNWSNNAFYEWFGKIGALVCTKDHLFVF